MKKRNEQVSQKCPWEPRHGAASITRISCKVKQTVTFREEKSTCEGVRGDVPGGALEEIDGLEMVRN